MAHTMQLHPFYECVQTATELIEEGHTIYQHFLCAGCGSKQTMEDANVFHKFGKCEECGGMTNIEHDGCNYMLVTNLAKKSAT
jgi:hypothetical protein